MYHIHITMSAHVLLNLLNELGKSDKMRGLHRVYKFKIKAPQALHNTPPLLGAPKVIL